MEFVRLKYANNKLINSNLKEHRDIIEEYIIKKHMEYLGFVPVLFGPSGKTLEIDLIFRKPAEAKLAEAKPAQEQPAKPEAKKK